MFGTYFDHLPTSTIARHTGYATEWHIQRYVYHSFFTARRFVRVMYAIAVLSVRLSIVHYIRIVSKRKKCHTFQHFNGLNI